MYVYWKIFKGNWLVERLLKINMCIFLLEYLVIKKKRKEICEMVYVILNDK